MKSIKFVTGLVRLSYAEYLDAERRFKRPHALFGELADQEKRHEDDLTSESENQRARQ